MLTAAVAVVALTILLPVRPPSPATQTDRTQVYKNPATTRSSTADTDFADVMDVELRAQDTGAAHTAPTSQTSIESPLGLKLTGTIVEPQHSYAVFENATGEMMIKSVGDHASGARVTAIDHDTVILQYNGQPLTLRVPRPLLLGNPGL